ncbi:trypsin-like peptidase domain-containing protein [bacterium]|nr:trypsin-like peptidase domain-containing protein [bacterium]
MFLKCIKRTYILIFTVFLMGLNPAQSYDSEETTMIAVYEKINPAIVAIDAELKIGVSGGTGCIINSNGTILTSKHVIDGSKKIEVTTYDGKTYSAVVLPTNNKSGDLALIKINPKTPLNVIKLGNSDSIKVGQKVLAIGNPFGFAGTLTQGIVSRIDLAKNKIQTDAAINPGCSGGPILNTTGEVIGISQSIYNPDNNISNIGIGFAIPSDEVKKFIAHNIK